MVRITAKKIYNNVVEFIKTNDYEEEFYKLYHKDIDDWNFSVSDTDVIINILDRIDGDFIVDYDNKNTGSIIVYTLLPVGVL